MRETSAKRFWWLGVVATIEGLLPPLFSVMTGVLVAAVPSAVASGGMGTPEGHRLLWILVATATVFLLMSVPQTYYLAHLEGFRARVNAARRDRVMRATLALPGINHLEDSDYLDTLRLASNRDWPDPGSFSVGVYGVYTERVTAAVSAIIVGIRFNWLVAIVLYVVWSIVGLYFRHGQAQGYSKGRAQLRRSSYFRGLAYDGVSGKEVRVFGLSGWVLDHFTGSWFDVMEHVWQGRSGRMRKRVALLVLVIVVNLMAYGYLAYAAHHGEVTLANLAIVAGTMSGISAIARMGDATMSVSLGATCFPALYRLERIARGEESLDGLDRPLAMSGSAQADDLPQRDIVFEDVTFRYPGAEQPVYQNLHLRIVAGTSLGIVGNNGAGKTTLIKLLARMYEPESGRILVDGVDIKTIDPVAWQRRVAAIFQDFVHYDYSVTDNVAFGSIEHRNDTAMLRRAADRVGATELIESLPDKWDTVLSRRYAGGRDLSGGQWQRIALARALFAVEGGAGVLVLDEPTANLDARAEVQLFDEFLDVTRGSTSVLISHRFSTVRRADRIVVIERGQVVEDGTHDSLLELDGLYARAFNLQADRYKDEVN